MATHFDLEEQEQLDRLKSFWKQYGNLITWALIAVLAAFAAWNGWNWWQREQAAKSGAMFDQLDRAAQAGEVDQAARIFADMKGRYPGTAFTEQAGLITAKLQYDKGQRDAALATLEWVGSNALETPYRTIAKLRAAGILLDEKKYDAALERLGATNNGQFAALASDRRGDVLLAQGKKDEAKGEYLKAWQAMESQVDYRRLIEAKLTALGASPTAAGPAAQVAQ